MESYRQQLAEQERRIVERAIRKTKGNVTRAARLLQMPLRSIWNKITDHDINVEQYREG
jgi:DNA-binding NtrC family response regulator